VPEFGIWSDESGGFVEAQCWSRQEALDRIMELGDEAPEDATGRLRSPGHTRAAGDRLDCRHAGRIGPAHGPWSRA
jgi:hypothetical protein